MPVTSLLWCMCCTSDESAQINTRNDILYWWFFSLPFLHGGVWWDMPTYHSQSSVIWSNYWCCIHANLLYRTTECTIEPVVIKSVFLQLFILTMDFIYMTFIKSQTNILTILCVPQSSVTSISLKSTLVVFLIYSFTLSNTHCWRLLLAGLLETINHSITVFQPIESN